MKRQTLIPVNAEGEHSFASFHPGDNTELVAELQWVAGGARGGGRMLYFWGEAGCGKTHLLNACCHLAQASGRPHAYLPLDGLVATPGGGVLSDLPADAVLCVDDVQAAAASDSWQAVLFGLYEKLLGGDGDMVVAADRPLAALHLGLKDLASRLASGGACRLAPLSEADKLTALAARARHKGFELGEPALRFIITYYQRDTASLFALLERIDTASLAQQRKITVPFLKTLL